MLSLRGSARYWIWSRSLDMYSMMIGALSAEEGGMEGGREIGR